MPRPALGSHVNPKPACFWYNFRKLFLCAYYLLHVFNSCVCCFGATMTQRIRGWFSHGVGKKTMQSSRFLVFLAILGQLWSAKGRGGAGLEGCVIVHFHNLQPRLAPRIFPTKYKGAGSHDLGAPQPLC